jgi:hypothetical protein
MGAVLRPLIPAPVIAGNLTLQSQSHISPLELRRNIPGRPAEVED